MAKTIMRLYDELSTARNAVEDLVNAGLAHDAISIVAKDRDGRYKTFFEQQEHQASEGLPEDEEEGAISGGLIGGLAGLLLGLGVVAIPGIGLVLAAGPLATMLLGAGTGAITGSLVGAILEWAPEEDAEYYAEKVQQGRTLVCVSTSDEQADQVTSILQQHHPVDIR
jgi:hypothetical protein